MFVQLNPDGWDAVAYYQKGIEILKQEKAAAEKNEDEARQKAIEWNDRWFEKKRKKHHKKKTRGIQRR